MWRRKTGVLHLVLVMILALPAGAARRQTWIPIGPPGGNVRALASDPREPQRIFLGTAEGILYRSDDGGGVWQPLSPGFPRRGCSLDEIVVDPQGIVYVGYWEVHGRGGGVARSTNAGQTFTILKALEGESVRALAVAPSSARHVAVGTLTGVFLSQDGGTEWKRITPAGDSGLQGFESLAFDPTNPKVIYAGTRHLAYKTVDGGATWSPVHEGMIDDSHVMTLTVSRDQHEQVYATACTGIYHSRNGGRAWTKIEGIPEDSRRTRAFHQGADGQLLLAGTTQGLWISQDAGRSWRCATAPELVINALLVQPNGAILLGTEDAGILRSTDRGWNWTASNTGFAERLVSQVVFDPQERRTVVAVGGGGRSGGVYASSSLPEWTRLENGLEKRQVLSLGLQGNTLLAGTDSGLFVRPRGTNAWTRLPVVIDGSDLRPRVNLLIVMGPNRLLAATPGDIVLSHDRGRTWIGPVLGGTGEVLGVAQSTTRPDIVVAATRSGVFRSEDGGRTWAHLSSQLNGAGVHALAFSPSRNGALFATTSGGLYRSDDQGFSWRLVGGGIPHSDLTGIAIHPNGRILYASDFTHGGIFRSQDGGATWERMPANGLGSERIWTLALDPSAPDRLLAASSAGGLHLLAPESSTIGAAALK